MPDDAHVHIHDDDSHHDDGSHHDDDSPCLCDLALGESDIFRDVDLPPARGGVTADTAAPVDDDTIADCATLGGGSFPTRDDELPAATGGIAS